MMVNVIKLRPSPDVPEIEYDCPICGNKVKGVLNLYYDNRITCKFCGNVQTFNHVSDED